MRRLYRAGRNVTAALDVPLAQTRGKLPCVLFGRPASLPKGVIRIALRHAVPIVVFSMSLDAATGRRLLRISRPHPGDDEQALAQAFADALEALIAEDSAAWQMWPHVQDFFDPYPDAPATPDEAAHADFA
jgi:lauroyl/myristoyl acyltransferase